MTPNFWATTNSMPGLPGGPVAPPPIPGTGGVTPLPFQPGTGGVTPRPNTGGPALPGGPTLPGGPVAPPPIPGTGGVYPRPANPYEPKDVTPNPGPGGTSPGGPTLPQPGGGNRHPGPSIDGWDPLKWDARRPPEVSDPEPQPPRTGGVYPRPGGPPEVSDPEPQPPRTGGVYPKPVVRQPEWNPRRAVQPSFRRPGFWQQIRQMAQPSVSTSAAGQARAQQQQSNAARARAAFLAGFNGVRRPAYQVDPYTPDGGPSYPGGSRYFDESAQYPQNAMRAY